MSAVTCEVCGLEKQLRPYPMGAAPGPEGGGFMPKHDCPNANDPLHRSVEKLTAARIFLVEGAKTCAESGKVLEAERYRSGLKALDMALDVMREEARRH